MPFRKCSEVLAAIDRIADGEASAWERARFKLHLGMCRPCARYYAQYVAVRDAAGQVDAARLPGDFTAVMGRMLAAMERGPGARNASLTVALDGGRGGGPDDRPGDDEAAGRDAGSSDGGDEGPDPPAQGR